MSEQINLWRPDLEVADKDEIESRFAVEPFDLHGRHHEVREAAARIGVTRLPEGVHLDLDIRCEVETTCDRTLEPVTLSLRFGDSELVTKPTERELCIEDWVLYLPEYAREALPAEVPMQVFASGTEPVRPEESGGEMDPRWRGLDDLFASGM